ncbi:hypothetical protein GUJ93_ZPchr0002g23451 [Zizania palustris]|uniref:Uncharacterized protein n=1 Tax=Zizania palustris TaxID=103762 RepID=A0A8J5RUS5_ZIZPA|nr:hypothetical protein GUJ93_ZPchr0002g23451 [Zizania palustris]
MDGRTTVRRVIMPSRATVQAHACMMHAFDAMPRPARTKPQHGREGGIMALGVRAACMHGSARGVRTMVDRASQDEKIIIIIAARDNDTSPRLPVSVWTTSEHITSGAVRVTHGGQNLIES